MIIYTVYIHTSASLHKCESGAGGLVTGIQWGAVAVDNCSPEFLPAYP